MRRLYRLVALSVAVLFVACLGAVGLGNVVHYPRQPLPAPLDVCEGHFCWLGVEVGRTLHAQTGQIVGERVRDPLNVRTTVGIDGRGYYANFYPAADNLHAGSGQIYFTDGKLQAGWLLIWLGEPCGVSYRANIGYTPPIPELVIRYPFLLANFRGDRLAHFSPMTPVESIAWIDPTLDIAGQPDVCVDNITAGVRNVAWNGFRLPGE